jgi:hypothetical protein
MMLLSASRQAPATLGSLILVHNQRHQLRVLLVRPLRHLSQCSTQ